MVLSKSQDHHGVLALRATSFPDSRTTAQRSANVRSISVLHGLACGSHSESGPCQEVQAKHSKA